MPFDNLATVVFVHQSPLSHRDVCDGCAVATLDAPEANGFEQFGVNVHVLQPGQPNCRYHNELDQEAFLVLSGECLLIVEEQERHLRADDFFHCPPLTRHVFVGAGDAPCAVLMIGGRTAPDGGGYSVSDVASCHGAGVPQATIEPKVAYAGDAPFHGARIDLSWIFDTRSTSSR